MIAVAYLSAEQILDADDLPWEDVEVPEWGGTVRVRGMSGTDRDRFEAAMLSKDMRSVSKESALERYRARLAAACIVDENGQRMFRSDAEIKRLGEKSAQALQRVCDVASRLSGLTDADQEELLGG
ncbi:phage tail assembly chaperone [Streptomyces thermodiastaticus]|uniref:phage tail assembly chaperone n=1 Tax=Streptomyces thermodiastaticus TaxID=44061 RepID=UPI001E4BB51E|nr:phage tail assembly chaperone [Streptomyces thermodiastaticus]MCE7550907.1 phage tail assembly chaperone [Streptomyces thermodiastaticus]